LLVETPLAPSLSRGIKRLNERYAQHYNTRHERVGHLFQGRFKGVLVERESHLLELIRYIVLNPVRSGSVELAGDWPWSNYRATAGLEPAPGWLEVDWTLDQFGGTDRSAKHEAYRGFVADGRGASYNPREAVVSQIYLGGESFCRRMQQLVDAKPRSTEVPRAQRVIVAPSIDDLASHVATAFGLHDKTALRQRTRHPYRRALAHLAQLGGDVPQLAIATWLGVSERSVSKMVRASERQTRADDGYRALLDSIRSKLREDVIAPRER
jgi:hypothetical protein